MKNLKLFFVVSGVIIQPKKRFHVVKENKNLRPTNPQQHCILACLISLFYKFIFKNYDTKRDDSMFLAHKDTNRNDILNSRDFAVFVLVQIKNQSKNTLTWHRTCFCQIQRLIGDRGC